MAPPPYFRPVIAQLTGRLLELNPARVIVDVHGVGYEVHISLHTYEALQGKTEVTLQTLLRITEDAHTLYGFAGAEEKEMFQLLIGVSGVGAATARLMLSHMKPGEIRSAIASGDARTLERVKGIGRKTAERLVLELRDKALKTASGSTEPMPAYNSAWQDAFEALQALGIPRAAAEQALKKLKQTQPDLDMAETIIKQVLKSI